MLCFTLQYAESHYFVEGNEYKITLLHPWVWDYEVRSVYFFVAVEKNVDVDGGGRNISFFLQSRKARYTQGEIFS